MIAGCKILLHMLSIMHHRLPDTPDILSIMSHISSCIWDNHQYELKTMVRNTALGWNYYEVSRSFLIVHMYADMDS